MYRLVLTGSERMTKAGLGDVSAHYAARHTVRRMVQAVEKHLSLGNAQNVASCGHKVVIRIVSWY